MNTVGNLDITKGWTTGKILSLYRGSFPYILLLLGFKKWLVIPSISLYGEVRYVKVSLKLPLKWFQHNCLDSLTTTKCHKLRASSLGRHGGEAIKEGELASRLTRHGTRYVLDTKFFPLKGKWQMTILPHPKEVFAFFCPLLQTRRIYALLLPYLKTFGH